MIKLVVQPGLQCTYRRIMSTGDQGVADPVPGAAALRAPSPSQGGEAPAVVQCIQAAVLNEWPKDGGVMALVPPVGGVKSGQGKRSAEEMEYEDSLFTAERKAELKELVNLKNISANDEVELMEHCKGRVRQASALASKCSSKAASLKRRKDGAAAVVGATIAELQFTATTFQRFYTEMASENPFGSSIQEVVQSVQAAGYELNRLMHMKRVRALMQDDLRFGCLESGRSSL